MQEIVISQEILPNTQNDITKKYKEIMQEYTQHRYKNLSEDGQKKKQYEIFFTKIFLKMKKKN